MNTEATPAANWGRRSHIALSVVMAMIVLGIFGIAYVDLPIKGRITDSESGEPLADAVVVVLWQRHELFHGAVSAVTHVAEARTASDGSFSVPGRYFATFLGGRPDVVVLKAGFVPDSPEVIPSRRALGIARTVATRGARDIEASMQRYTGDPSQYVYAMPYVQHLFLKLVSRGPRCWNTRLPLFDAELATINAASAAVSGKTIGAWPPSTAGQTRRCGR